MICIGSLIGNEQHVRRFLTVTYTWARRCAITFIGGTVVLIGILMIVFPGPAFIVIPAGLAILGIEFACARRWLRQLRTTGTQMLGRTRLLLRPSSSKTAERDDRIVRGSTYLPQRPVPASPVPASYGPASDRATTNTKTGYYRIP